jgi:hypothetical protein
MPDIASMIEAVVSVFPLLTIIVVAVVVFQVAFFFIEHTKRSFEDVSDFRPKLEREKRKNAALVALIAQPEKPKNGQNLALLDQPDKPKRMFVRLGDDGELVEWSGDHEADR